jgi:kynurenine formamidase
MKFGILSLSFLLFFYGLVFQSQASEVLDLTYAFDEETIYWPTEHGFLLEKRGWKITEAGYFYAANIITAPEHGGTHIDAPVHFAHGRWKVADIPLKKLMGRAAMIDLSEKIDDHRDYQISKQDILDWEQIHGPLGKEDIVLFNTGWHRFWGKKKKYLGTKREGDVKNLHFPGISAEAAVYLVDRKVKGVGLDTASLDYGQSKDFMAHRILLDANIYGIENVASIDKLPPRGAYLYVAPMKIKEGTGAPTRIYAVVP